jgi:hypothetical protein
MQFQNALITTVALYFYVFRHSAAGAGLI